MKNNRVIPFKMLPAAWGLVGKPYLEAEANYYYDGEDLDRELAKINYKDTKALAAELLRIDLEYGHISEYDYDKKMLEIMEITDPKTLADVEIKHGKMSQIDYDYSVVESTYPEDSLDREKAMLEIQFKHGKITKQEYDKSVATLDEKPWIGIIDQGFDLEKGVNGVFFEFDWNIYWIDYLRLNGYSGHIEEEIVEQWFQDVCRSTSQSNQDEFDTIPVAGRVATRTNRRSGNDGTFYS